MYKNVFGYVLTALLISLIGCAPQAATTSTSHPAPGIPIINLPTAVPAVKTTTTTTAILSYGSLNIVVPVGLANGINGIRLPRADSPNLPAAEWTPGHTQIEFVGYPLQEKSLRPQIYVYPAQAYAEMKTEAFESIRRLDNLFGSPGAAITGDKLPAVPFLNLSQVFSADIKALPFKSGQGVRYLTQFAQGIVPINNHEMVYAYQGLTKNGAFYMVVILPVSLAGLPEDNSWNVQAPPVGSEYRTYVDAVVNKINQKPASAFTPDLNMLDELIQSIEFN